MVAVIALEIFASGVAMVRWLAWLELELQTGRAHTECSLAQRLRHFRALDPLFVVRTGNQKPFTVLSFTHSNSPSYSFAHSTTSTPVQGLSFETISGFAANGAIIHCKSDQPATASRYPPPHTLTDAPDEATCARVKADNSMYLCDSGGQYLDGCV